MKFILSPAKSLDYERPLPIDRYTNPVFLKEAQQLNKVLKKNSAKELSQLMKISDSLAQLNYLRNQEWHLPFNQDNARPAVYAFKGDVYRGLDAYSLPIEKIDYMQGSMRILSGLYGLLKPLDLIQPYRLEMGTKLPVAEHSNLYDFWREKLTQALEKDLDEGEPLLNLASQEYAKAIDIKRLKNPMIQVQFKEYRDGNYKTIALFAKKARGLMSRYLIETRAKTLEDLVLFNAEGYAFDTSLSSETSLVFTRWEWLEILLQKISN